MSTRWILLISLLALALGSCGGSPQVVAGQSPGLALQEASTKEPSSDLPEKTIQLASTPETTDMTSTPPSEEKSVDLAKQDLADRLKIDLAQIALVKTMEIKWPNTSIGCKPGAGQILTESNQVYGYRIWLEVAGEEYIYHVGLTEQIIFCPKLNPGANNPLLTTPDGSIQGPQNQSP
jgi:hypothetical protein